MSSAPGPHTETELKLRVPPQTLAKLRQTPTLIGRGKGRAVTKTLASTYFDTPDRSLQRRLATLRVRRIGDGYVQTLKSATLDAGGLTRGEWEWPVDGAQPDLSVIVEADALALLGPISADDLRPVFESHIRRTTRVVERDGCTVELAFDSGELRTEDGAVRELSEVELELKSGDPSALFTLALEIAKLAPVRLETRTKAARGFALAAGLPEDGSQKAERLELTHDTTVEETFARILRNGLLHCAANEACVLTGTDPEGVHQMRVALRRLRSAVSLFRRFIPADRYLWLAGELRWLAGSLGAARDWDVFATELVAPVAEGLGNSTPLARDIDALQAASDTRRLSCYEQARAAIQSERYVCFLLELGAWVEAKGWRAQPVSEHSVQLFAPIGTLADTLLEKRLRRARKLGRGFARLPTDQRHQVRIALKKMRYAADFFRGLYDDKATRRFITLLASLQDALGHLNDVATASRLIQALHPDGKVPSEAEARAAGLVVGWHARGLATSEPQLVAAWENFLDAKPFWSKPTALPSQP